MTTLGNIDWEATVRDAHGCDTHIRRPRSSLSVPPPLSLCGALDMSQSPSTPATFFFLSFLSLLSLSLSLSLSFGPFSLSREISRLQRWQSFVLVVIKQRQIFNNQRGRSFRCSNDPYVPPPLFLPTHPTVSFFAFSDHPSRYIGF